MDPKLIILSRKDFSEEEILIQIYSLFKRNKPDWWLRIPVGNSLLYDFELINTRQETLGLKDLPKIKTWDTPHIDLKYTAILMNKGNFKGYQHIFAKTDESKNIPTWFEDKQFDKIHNYIEREFLGFLSAYKTMQKKLS